jgi:hypothetical protein
MQDNYINEVIKEFEEKLKNSIPSIDKYERALILNSVRQALEKQRKEFIKELQGLIGYSNRWIEFSDVEALINKYEKM